MSSGTLPYLFSISILSFSFSSPPLPPAKNSMVQERPQVLHLRPISRGQGTGGAIWIGTKAGEAFQGRGFPVSSTPEPLVSSPTLRKLTRAGVPQGLWPWDFCQVNGMEKEVMFHQTKKSSKGVPFTEFCSPFYFFSYWFLF